MSVLQKLTEGIIQRDVSREGAAILNKWEKTGLLEGLGNDGAKNNMAVLLENQAKELLREASSMAAGDVEGFAAVAFPIVRRVFGGLIANDLVSVQPMSLPSGLIFFLDFTHTHAKSGVDAGDSVYGGHVVGRQITGGVKLDLDPTISTSRDGGGGFYDLGTGYSSPTGSHVGLVQTLSTTAIIDVSASALSEAQKKEIRFDPDILATAGNMVTALQISASSLSGTGDLADLNKNALAAISQVTGSNTGATLVRRLTKLDSSGNLQLFFVGRPGAAPDADGIVNLSYPMSDKFEAGGAGAGAADALGSVVGNDTWGLEEPDDATGEVGSAAGKHRIPEIDIKVDSIAVTAVTKKLKAKWSPELGQDLNAYHNLDAEVELTGILSEQIALEIDQEILGDLIVGAKAGTRYWSRAPGLFVDSNGSELGATSAAPDFTGTVSEWYETLIETINDVSAQIHRKTLRGGANFVVCSPEVANILEFTSGFRASVTADADKGDIGAVKVGALSKKFEVFVDPYFPRNVILVGRKGSSFLESGYVYAPYVPLQVTPTIFGTEDFVPRKGVMTRYAKKMVRPDMYGLVIVRGLLGEAGAS